MENLRNEVKITLAGEERTMRATFSAIRGIEASLGKSIIAIISQSGNGDLSITDAVTIIHYGLRGYDDKRLSLDQVGDAVMDVGFSAVSLAAIQFLSVALGGVSVGKPQEAATQ
ncbi:GTA-gp10 family protein [Rhizobium leguminosarum]|uniref:GTA-gp10 family protein n=1 Tax=Rhizobium leguminosarum TaxID=384 RepID=UPI001C989487|nr:GTA-gp10 family protein [Rhizobium leguminosarum]MBY5698398.1 gene transfer agent family protein [Rhizobium leguminosarum]